MPKYRMGRDENRRQEAAAAAEQFDDVDSADVEPTTIVSRRAPGKKDTRRWCKGREGREHSLVIQIPPNTYYRRSCGWRVQPYVNVWSDRDYYECAHVELCAGCGKIFRRHYNWLSDTELRDEECPNFVPPSFAD